MPVSTPTKPVEDSISKVNNEIAVGSDPEFQRRWWKFEFIVWTLFTSLAVLALLGVFGRGHFAKSRLTAADQSIEVSYERIERYGTPSVMRVHFGPAAIHDGIARFWVSESLIKELGAQKVAPQPSESALGEGGVLYSFPAPTMPAIVEFSLQPTSPGRVSVQLRVPGSETVNAPVFVMP